MTGRLLVLTLAGAAATTGCAVQDSTAPTVDPATAGVLIETCTRLRETPAFSVRIDTDYDRVLDSGQKVQLSRRDQVALARPDKLKIEVFDDLGERSVYYSGRLVTEVLPERGIYAMSSAPDNIDEMLDKANESGVAMPFEDLLRTRPCAAFANAIETGSYLGLHYVDGDWRHHMLLTTDQGIFQLWVSDPDNPTIDKVVVDYPDLKGAPQVSVRFSDWDFAPAFGDSDFRFQPDGEMQQVAFPIQSNRP